MMRSERSKILDMVSENKITADEAVVLLQKLTEMIDEKEVKEKRFAKRNIADGDTIQYDNEGNVVGEDEDHWFSDLKNSFTESAKSIIESIEKADFSFGLGGPKVSFNLESDKVADEINLLSLNAKNDSLRVKSYPGDTIIINGTYNPKIDTAPEINLYEKEGEYILEFDETTLLSLEVVAKIPQHIHIDELILNNKNAMIQAENLDVGNGRIETTNSHIILKDIKANDDIHVQTKNALVKATGLEAVFLDMRTTNAPMKVYDCKAKEGRISTTNGDLVIDNANINRLYPRTKNARLMVKDWKNDDEDVSLYVLDAETSNGSITVEEPKNNKAYRLRAVTSNSSVHADLKDFVYTVDKEGYIDGASETFDADENYIDMKIRTTNGTVHIK